MSEAKWTVAVQNGGNLTGAVVTVLREEQGHTLELQFAVTDCIAESGDVRTYDLQAINR